MGDSGKSKAEVLRSRLMLPLLFCFAVPSFYIVGIVGSGTPVWWHAHPVAMLLCFVYLVGQAVTLKKVGGYDNTKMHGYVMFIASIVAAFGAYVMYSNKETYGKEHYTSLHSWIGGSLLLMFLPYPFVAWFAYNPDDGKLKTDKNARAMHKYSGRFVILLGYAAVASGMYTIEQDPAIFAFLCGPLVPLFYFLS